MHTVACIAMLLVPSAAIVVSVERSVRRIAAAFKRDYLVVFCTNTRYR
jgi:hypothetical protein